MSKKKIMFRTQWDGKVGFPQVGFPPTVVQPGMSPNISSMVKSRSVGGNIEEYEMNGIESGAPFDSEYVDFFDIQDMIQNNSAVERENAQSISPEKEAPPNDSTAENESSDDNDAE